MKINIKRIISFALACSLVVFVGAFFLVKPITANAEEVQRYYTYNSNDFWSPAVLHWEIGNSVNGPYDLGYYTSTGLHKVPVGFVNFKVSMSNAPSSNNASGKTLLTIYPYYTIGQLFTGYNYYPSESVLQLSAMQKMTTYQWDDANGNFYYRSREYDNSFVEANGGIGFKPVVRFTAYMSSMDFIPNIYKVVQDSWFDSSVQGVIYHYNRLVFYDINDNHAVVQICANIGSTANDFTSVASGWESRTYYLSNPLEFSDDEKYDTGYQDGYQQGYDSGQLGGYDVGYRDGLSTGNEQGYQTGLNVGRGENITFLTLLTAVFDAPIQAIFNALDFEILGMNMKNFFYGLMSISIVIFVIRFITGKKGD